MIYILLAILFVAALCLFVYRNRRKKQSVNTDNMYLDSDYQWKERPNA